MYVNSHRIPFDFKKFVSLNKDTRKFFKYTDVHSMRKRHLLLALLSSFLLLTTSQKLSAQSASSDIALGDKFFKVEDYYLATEHYQEALNKDPGNAYATYQLAECYRLYFEYDRAEKMYKKSVDLGDEKYPLAQFYYALMQKINGRYGPAGESFEYFIATYEPKSDDDKFFDLALLHYNGCILASEEIARPQRDFVFHHLEGPVNTGYSEFAAAIADNDSSIVITSARMNKKKDPTYEKLGGGYTDNYWYQKTENGWEEVDTKKNGFDQVNGDLNDGAGVFNSDMSKYYYTKCDEVNEDQTEYECAIYVSKKNGDKWQQPEKLNKNINATGYWNAQPSLSGTGDTMYFVSKRPGGQGMHDIWFSVDKDGNDNWGKAKNMGTPINTPFIDMSPNYYSQDGILFFASNGHEGFGGLDIFMAKGENLDIIRNIGLPFNSNRDDFYFALGEEKGYLSSNRSGGLGNDDIFVFNIESRKTLIETISPIEDDSVNSITISGRILDENGEPAPDVVVMLLDDEGNILKYTKTDDDGVFVFANLDPSKEYSVVLQEEDPRLTMEKYGVEDLELTASSESPDTKDEIIDREKPFSGGRQLFDNIYFDFDKDKIRREARKILNDLASYYKKNPNISIEVKAHTDSRGSNSYNNSLSKRRADAAMSYLMNKGVPESAFVIYAQGEGAPIASNANPTGRQLNRRVEFQLSGERVDYNTQKMAYVVQPNNTIHDIAKMFNMSVEDVKEFNDLQDGNLQAHQAIFVRRGPEDDKISPVTLAHAGRPSLSGFSGSESGANYMTRPVHNPFKPNEVGTPSDAAYNQGVVYGKDDGSGYYTVLPRNTLFSIGKIFGISVDDLKTINGLRSNNLRIGQRLKVKADAIRETTPFDNRGVFADHGITISHQKGEIIELGGETRYVVKEGDTFYTVCNDFNMEFEQLRKLNKLPNYILRPGMVLRVVPDAGKESLDMEEIKKEAAKTLNER